MRHWWRQSLILRQILRYERLATKRGATQKLTQHLTMNYVDVIVKKNLIMVLWIGGVFSGGDNCNCEKIFTSAINFCR